MDWTQSADERAVQRLRTWRVHVEFAQAISRSPELKRMYQSALKSGLNKQQARHAVHAELAKRLGMKPPEVSVDLDRLNSLDLSE